jgi:hypothetical protein
VDLKRLRVKIDEVLMAIIGKESFDEQEFIHEFFASLSKSECQRMFEFFKSQVDQKFPPRPIDWSDRSGDGSLKVSPPAMAATNRR